MTNWIGPILGALIGVILTQIFNWLKARKGDAVLVRRIAQTNELEVSVEFRKDLEIKYKGVPTSQLVVNTFLVQNQGENNLDNLKFSLTFDAAAEGFFVIPKVIDPLGITKITSDPKTNPQQIDFERPFLNKAIAHKQERIEIALISDVLLDVNAIGGGRGWSVVYQDDTKKKDSIIAVEVLGVFLPFKDLFSLLGNNKNQRKR